MFCFLSLCADAKHSSATAQWSANVNLNLEQRGVKARSYPITGFNGPAYTIPSQHYPGRLSPDKTDRDRTPRTPNAKAASPGPKSNRSVSPFSDRPENVTPGCTDYTPRQEKFLKQEP